MRLERAMRELREKLDGADYDIVVMVKGADGHYHIAGDDVPHGGDGGIDPVAELVDGLAPDAYKVRVLKAYHVRVPPKKEVGMADAIPLRAHPWERQRGDHISKLQVGRKRAFSRVRLVPKR